MSTEDDSHKALRSELVAFFKRTGHGTRAEQIAEQLLIRSSSPLNNGDFILALADRHASRVGLSYPIDGGERERGKT